MKELEIIGCPAFKKGHKIHIKKKNRGKFTASAKKAGLSVQEHARSVLNNPNATPLLKKRANFVVVSSKWKHENGAKINKPLNTRFIKKDLKGDTLTKDEEDYITDKERKLLFLIDNRNTYNKLLTNIPHKRAVTNVLLNEGYATNMLNLKLRINPDSLVIGSNPSENPGEKAYDELGNFGLDYISNEEAKLSGIPLNKLKKKKAFDGGTWQTSEKLSIKQALPIINFKLNNVKKWLYDKYGSNKVSEFFKAVPNSEDRLLYAGYKMPLKMLNNINAKNTILDLYHFYDVVGGRNKAFNAVDRYLNEVDTYFDQ